VKYADGFVLLAKGQVVLQGEIDRLNEIGRYYGKEVNVNIINVLRISRRPSTTQIMIEQKQMEHVEYCIKFSITTSNDARRARKLNPILL